MAVAVVGAAPLPTHHIPRLELAIAPSATSPTGAGSVSHPQTKKLLTPEPVVLLDQQLACVRTFHTGSCCPSCQTGSIEKNL